MPLISGRYLEGLRGRAWRQVFKIFEPLGIHVTPVHYSYPIPDTRHLSHETWERTSSNSAAIAWNEAAQLNLLCELGAAYREELDSLGRATKMSGSTPSPVFYFGNGSFEAVDAELLYSIVRHYKPGQVIEIGSGYSTLLMIAALDANSREGHSGRIHCIDPYPRPFVKKLVASGRVQLDTTPIQKVPLSRFEELGAGDILFIDSSHVAMVGSDVSYEVLDVLPRLHPGVLVHIHDIFLPANYPVESILKNNYFWNEQYLLEAFLAFNREYEVVISASYLHLRHRDELARYAPSYDPTRPSPGSLWIRRASPSGENVIHRG